MIEILYLYLFTTIGYIILYIQYTFIEREYITYRNGMQNTLIKINTKLWDLENAKRAAEKTGEFGEKFINDARNVYKLNDERAKSKLAINETLGSNIKEVKSHN